MEAPRSMLSQAAGSAERPAAERFKRRRLGRQLLERAADPDFPDQVLVVFGGTGAVGGAAVLQMLSLFEEALRCRAPAAEVRPRILLTGRTHSEIRQFTRLLFDVHRRDHHRLPERVEGVGYRTASGVLVEMDTFSVDPRIPGLEEFDRLDRGGREQAVRRLVEGHGLDPEGPAAVRLALFERLLTEQVGHPFSGFLARYRTARGRPAPGRRFGAVVVGIPLASIAAYRLPQVEEAALLLGATPGGTGVERLKELYLAALQSDLVEVRERLADEVLAAHTTGVGGMYDEGPEGRRTIRLGFAHSALDRKLADKQAFASRLAASYAAAGIKMLVTAAAIGVDGVLIRHSPPMNPAIRRRLQDRAKEGLEVIPRADLRQRLKVYRPHRLDLLDEPHQPVKLEHGRPLVLDYTLRSGENGYFTVSNTDALYRVMRVTSASELGLLLARVALLGDDPDRPAFPGNTCYYSETDYSRQVFDLLGQPQLRRSQTRGLQPKALQDLGSAKHQAELHTLGLLILLQRLKSLHLDEIPAHVDLARFDPEAYFESHSRALTLEQVARRDPAGLARELEVLATARAEDDLRPLKSFFQADPDRQEAARRILRAVLQAAWAVPAIGSPILIERDGRRRVVAGCYAASIDRIVTHRDTFAIHLRRRFASLRGFPPAPGDAEFERFVEFHVANNGFVDLRPVAVLVTARSDEEELDGKVRVFRREAEFVDALRALPPYGYFTTSGLVALLVRLRGLSSLAHQLDLTLGSANEYRAHLPFDDRGRPLLVPGVVEAFRMVSEGLEKNTGLERLDGRWGYYLDAPLDTPPG